jgi:hypothetical protein
MNTDNRFITMDFRVKITYRHRAYSLDYTYEVFGLGYFEHVNLKCIQVNFVVRVFVIPTREIYIFIAPHPECASRNLTHSSVTNGCEALSILADIS